MEQNRIKEIKKVNREVSMHEDSKEFIRYSVLTTRLTRFDSGKSIYNFTVGNVVTVREGSYFVKEQRHSEIRMWGGGQWAYILFDRNVGGLEWLL